MFSTAEVAMGAGGCQLCQEVSDYQHLFMTGPWGTGHLPPGIPLQLSPESFASFSELSSLENCVVSILGIMGVFQKPRLHSHLLQVLHFSYNHNISICASPLAPQKMFCLRNSV